MLSLKLSFCILMGALVHVEELRDTYQIVVLTRWRKSWKVSVLICMYSPITIILFLGPFYRWRQKRN